MHSSGKHLTCEFESWPRQWITKIQNIAHALHCTPITRPLSRLLVIFIRVVFGGAIAAEAKIHRSVHFGHSGLGVVINAAAVIGPNVMIGTHVVLGGKAPIKGAPIIHQGAIIHAGAKIIGPITVGEGAVVAANAVVVRDVAPRTLVGGVPAKVIKSSIELSNYTPTPRTVTR